jgi:iron complex transport system substrate-binding protein
MNYRPVFAAVLAFVLCVPISACFGPPPTPPDTFVLADGEGTNVTIKHHPARIISLTPSHTEVLFAIGVGAKVVGGTDFDNYPPEAAAVPDVLTNLHVNFEEIANKTPDLIFVSSLNNRADIERLRGLHFAVFFADAYAVSDVAPMIRLIGKAVEEQGNATRVASQLESSINLVTAKAANATSKPRTFYLLDDYGGWWTAGSGTRGNDMIAATGGANVFANVTGWSSVALESISAAAPEVIIVGLYVSINQTVMNSTSPWSSMPAVQHGRVYRVPDADSVDRPGPRLAQGLTWMLGAIHPELA